MNSANSIMVETSTWTEIEVALATGKLSMLPIGSACKEHGPHLPLNTDLRQAQWLAARVSESLPFIIWPTVNYGFYPAFVHYPGSCSISETAFIDSIKDVIKSICKHGTSPLILLNTGISTIGPLQKAMETSQFLDRVHLINVYSGTHFRQTESKIQTQRFGGHADEIETSIMLAIDPDAVNMQKATKDMERKVAGPLQRENPRQANYCPSGIIGDATGATAEKGKMLLNAIVTDIVNDIRSIMAKQRTRFH